MRDYWEFVTASETEQQKHLGTVLELNDQHCLVIGLNTRSSQFLGTKYSVVEVFILHGTVLRPSEIRVHVPGIDDFALYADFKLRGRNPEEYRAEIETRVFQWCKQRDYKEISIMELSKYVKELGAYSTDWN